MARPPAVLFAACLLLGLAACASRAQPGPPAGPAAPTEAIVVVLVTATPAAATSAPASPAADLWKLTAERRCHWVAYMHLTGFAPNSVISVDSVLDETKCPSGEPWAEHWTRTYPKKTDALGRVWIDYWYEATGSYRYVFTDEKGNRARLAFTIEPGDNGAPTPNATGTLAPAPTKAAPTEPAPTAAPTEPVEPQAVVKAASLNVRTGPGQNYPVAGKLEQGDKMYPAAQVNDCEWLQVGVVSMGYDLYWVAGGPQYVTLNVPCSTLFEQDSIPPTPTRAPIAPARPATGLLSRSGAGGSGVLRIKNGTDTDGVVILVTLGGTPVQAAYIRTSDTYEMSGIADGGYRLYFTKGEAWDANAKQFTENVTRQRFADTLTFGGTTAGYEVTLYGVSGGNAATEGVSEGGFPAMP